LKGSGDAAIFNFISEEDAAAIIELCCTIQKSLGDIKELLHFFPSSCILDNSEYFLKDGLGKKT
jgi:hypothetical protein